MKRSYETDYVFILPILLAILIYPSKRRTRIINGRNGQEEILDKAHRSSLPVYHSCNGKLSPDEKLASNIAVVDPVYAMSLLASLSQMDMEQRKKSFFGSQYLPQQFARSTGNRKGKRVNRNTIRGK